MESGRRIWSLPVAMVTALLLVGLLAAVVWAQTNAKPRIASLDDVTVRIGNMIVVDDTPQAAVAIVDLTEKITDATKVRVVTGDGVDELPDTADDVSVLVPESLAVTVMTTNTDRASLALADAYVTAPADHDQVDHDGDTGETDATALIDNVPSAVASWWDRLNNAEKIAALGLDTDQMEDDQESCDIVLCDDDGDILDYADAGIDVSTAAEDFDGTNGQLLITQAFHWDMLSADEMVAVATAAGIDDDATAATPPDFDAFKERFGGMTQAERDAVESLYTNNYLQRGQPAVLTVTHEGEAQGEDENTDERIGTATVYVKVSDGYGRLIPPPSGANTVGKTFAVDLQGVKLGQVGVAAPAMDGDGNVTGPGGVTPGDDNVRLITEVDDETSEVTRTLRIDGDAVTVATVVVTAVTDTQGVLIDRATDSTRARLYNGTGLGLSVNPTGARVVPNDTFTIKLEDYDKLEDGGTFTFRAYALTEEVNWVEIDFTIQLAVGNQAPVYTDSAGSSATISEALAVDEEIAEFEASDPDHTTGVEFSLSGDTTDVDGREIFTLHETTGKLTVGPMALNYQGDQTDGCPDPDAEEEDAEEEDAEEEDAEEEPCEETGTDNENNIYVLTVNAYDGELNAAPRTFTITVTDSLDIPATGSRFFIIDENSDNMVEEADNEEDEDTMYLVDSVGAKATVQLLDNDGDPLQAGTTYVIDKRNSPEDAVKLFDINEDGSLFLNEGEEN